MADQDAAPPPVPPLLQPVATPATPAARALRWLAGLAAIAVIAALMLVPNFWPFVTRLDHWTADWRTAYLSHQPATQNARIAIVAITDETLRNYVSSPIDRGLLADIVAAVDKAGATVIALDVLFLKETDPAKDERLIQAIRGARGKVILGGADGRVDLLQFQREFQAAYVSRAERPVGYVNTRHENDDVVRFTASAMPPGQSPYPKSFARLIAEAAGAQGGDDLSRPIPWLLDAADGKPAFLTIAGEKLVGAVATETAAALKGRVVIIGGVFPFRDQHRVPLSVRTGQTMPGVYIHATVAAGLLDPSRRVAEISPLATRLLLAVLAVAAVLMGLAFWRSMAVAFLGHGFAVALLLAVDAICFTQFRLLLPFTLAVTAWVAGITAGRFLGAVAAPNFSLRRIAR
jgi:adenylate cyclase